MFAACLCQSASIQFIFTLLPWVGRDGERERARERERDACSIRH